MGWLAVRSFRCRPFSSALVCGGAALATFCVVAWFAFAPPLVAEVVGRRLNRAVRVGHLYPWVHDGAFVLVVRDLVVMGQAPFDKEPLAVCDRVEVRPGQPPAVRVHGLDLRLFVAAAADNVRGVRRARASSSQTLGARTDEGWPRVQVLSGRVSAQVALPGGQRLALRARNLRGENRGRALELRLEDLVADVTGVANARLGALQVESTAAGDLMAHGEGLEARLPGGAPLFSHLEVDGSLSSEGWSVSAEAPRGSAGRLEWHANAGARGLALEVHAHDWPLGALAPLLDRHGVGTTEGTASGSLEAQLEPGQTQVAYAADLLVRGVSLHHPALDRVPWPNQNLRGHARGHFDLGQAQLSVDEGLLAPLGLPVDVKGWINLGARPTGSFSFHTPDGGWSCAILPSRLAPSMKRALAGLEMAGKLDFGVDFTFDAAHWDKLALDIQLPSTCEVKQEPRKLAESLDVLLGTKLGAILAERPELPLSPGHAEFTPITKLPTHLLAAFLTAEDAGFFLHEGFEPENIRRALIYNIERGRFVRGASTITQQVAKNLFLSHERTLTRKAVEAILSWRLEALVPKRRLLEMYLNLVELGPGFRGVGAAARTYFGKEPGALTPLEAAHLASLPPNPQGFARRFREGSVDEGWLARLYDLVGIMGRRGHLSASQVTAARGSRLRLRKI